MYGWLETSDCVHHQTFHPRVQLSYPPMTEEMDPNRQQHLMRYRSFPRMLDTDKKKFVGTTKIELAYGYFGKVLFAPVHTGASRYLFNDYCNWNQEREQQ